jgi:4-amino-4-deoxy-L-arabinose transferase-like glycosyltransferase
MRRISPPGWMVALLLAATFLRLAAWQSAPPGLRFDEMLVSYHADLIRDGARPLYIDDLAEEALFHYLFAAAQSLIAPHLFTLRWLSLACGLVSIAALYTLGRFMFNRRVGLLAAAIATVAFWSLLYSRLGLRIITLPAFVTLGLMFLWHGLALARERQPSPGPRRDFVIAGILFGLSAYTYSATRMLPAVFIGFLACLAVFNRPFLRRHGLNLLIAFALAVLIVLPLAVHIATVPAAERRLGEVEGPLAALTRGDVVPLINSTIITAGMFIATGDPEWLYNIPNRPVFDLLTGALFFLAVVISLRRLRQPAYAFVLVWLLAGLLPSMLTWPAASNSHGILAQAPAFLLAAIGLDAVATRWPRRGWVLIPIALGIFTVFSLTDYFVRWATSPTVQVEHQAGVAATAQQIDQLGDRPVVFSSGAVTHWNPWSVTAFRLTAPLGYTATRWFDARSSFIFPQGQTDLTLINAALDDQPAPLDGRLIEDLFPIVEPLPAASPFYSASHLVSTLHTRLITLTQAEVSWPPGTPISSSLSLPIAFADRLELIGYEVRRPTVEPGKNIRLTTYWRAQDRGLEPLSFFVHVLDAQGDIATQWDGYTYSPYFVQRGDIIAQVHFIPIEANFAEGTYRLQLGVYQSKTGARLPVLIDGQPMRDRIWLQTVEIRKIEP